MAILDSSLQDVLRTLKLTGMLQTLDARLAQTRDGTLGHLEFLQVLCKDEDRPPGDRCPDPPDPPRPLRGTDHPGRVRLHRPPQSHGPAVAALRWLAAGESVILFGLVGVGKPTSTEPSSTSSPTAAARVRFVKTSRVVADLAGGHADRTWGARVREYTRPAVVILDDFALRENTAAQADDLYELISERAVHPPPAGADLEPQAH